MRTNYATLSQEIHYSAIKRRIICEPLISQTAPVEYQCWCVNGEVDSLLVCCKNFGGRYDAWSYSTMWEHLCERIGENPSDIAPRPAQLMKMLAIAKRLSAPFPFVRVDLYEVDGRIYFAEMTFAPCANILVNYKPEFINRLGRKLSLPRPLTWQRFFLKRPSWCDRL